VELDTTPLGSIVGAKDAVTAYEALVATLAVATVQVLAWVELDTIPLGMFCNSG
jgi:hypothetical protein